MNERMIKRYITKQATAIIMLQKEEGNSQSSTEASWEEIGIPLVPIAQSEKNWQENNRRYRIYIAEDYNK